MAERSAGPDGIPWAAEPQSSGRGPRPAAIVTGATRGLGFLLARELTVHGFDVLICARSADGLDTAAEDLRRGGTHIATVVADVGDPQQAVQVVRAADREFGRLDMLVANAGTIQVGPVQDLDVTDFEQAMATMFWGLAHPCLAALPMLRQSRGRILAVTSIGGKLPAPHLLPYVAAKHAAVGFAEGLSVEAALDGVSVTVAVPGLMRTGSTRNARSAAIRSSSTPGSRRPRPSRACPWTLKTPPADSFEPRWLGAAKSS